MKAKGFKLAEGKHFTVNQPHILTHQAFGPGPQGERLHADIPLVARRQAFCGNIARRSGVAGLILKGKERIGMGIANQHDNSLQTIACGS